MAGGRAAREAAQDAAVEHAYDLWADRRPRHPGLTNHPVHTRRGTITVTDTDDRALVDDDGYPTAWGIQRLREFHGRRATGGPAGDTVVDPDADECRGVVQRRGQVGHAGSAGDRRLERQRADHLRTRRRFFRPAVLGVRAIAAACTSTRCRKASGTPRASSARYRAPPPSSRWPASSAGHPPQTHHHPTRHRGGVVVSIALGRCCFGVVQDLSVAVGSVCGVRASHSGWPTFPRRGIRYDQFALVDIPGL